MRRIASALALIGIGSAVGAPFVLGGSAVFGNLSDVAPHIFFSLIGLSLVSGIAKAVKLQILLVSLGQRLPFLRTLAITFTTDAAFLCSPAGAAGYVTNVALLKDADTSWSVSTTVVGAEQALDLVFFVIAIPVIGISALVPLARVLPTVPESVYVALPVGTLLTVLGLWCGRRYIAEALHNSVRANPWFQTRQIRITEFVSELRAQKDTLIRGSASQNIALLVLTALQWLARYGVLWFVLMELGYQMPFGFVLVLQAVVLHLALWTGIPAGGGSADLALAATLQPWVLNPTIATALLLWRFATLYFPLIVGAISLLALTCNWRINEVVAPET